MRRLGLTALLLASCAQPPASPAASAPAPAAPVASSLYVSSTPAAPPNEDPTSPLVNPGAFTVMFHNAYKVRVGADGKSVTAADGPLADAVNALLRKYRVEHVSDGSAGLPAAQLDQMTANAEAYWQHEVTDPRSILFIRIGQGASMKDALADFRALAAVENAALDGMSVPG